MSQTTSRPVTAAFGLQFAACSDGSVKMSIASFGPEFPELAGKDTACDIAELKPESLLQGLTLVGPLLLNALQRDNFEGVEMVGYEVEANKLLAEIE